MEPIPDEMVSRMYRPDKRVQAIRCYNCHRLRAHPNSEDHLTHMCGCGGVRFFATFPHPDEEQLALKLYAREIEEANLYTNLAQELIREKNFGPIPGEER